MDKRGNSKGLSTIVATLLIILLTLVAVAIIWMVIRGVINENAEQVSFGKFTVNLDITKADVIDETSIGVTVKRNPGKGNISGVAFVVYDEYNSEVVKSYIELKEFQLEPVEIILDELNATRAPFVKVSIAPIFKLESGKEEIGDIQDEWFFSEDISSPNIPSPNPSPDEVPEHWEPDLIASDNGGFEFGNLNNWYTNGAYFETTTDSQAGDYAVIYNAASNQNYYIQWDVDLTDYSARIDSGDARINASGWGRSLGANDLTRIQFIFLNAGLSPIETAYNSGYISNPNWWEGSVENNYEVPEGTRYLRVWANTYNPAGTPSGSIDSFSVSIGYFE